MGATIAYWERDRHRLRPTSRRSAPPTSRPFPECSRRFTRSPGRAPARAAALGRACSSGRSPRAARRSRARGTSARPPPPGAPRTRRPPRAHACGRSSAGVAGDHRRRAHRGRGARVLRRVRGPRDGGLRPLRDLRCRLPTPPPTTARLRGPGAARHGGAPPRTASCSYAGPTCSAATCAIPRPRRGARRPLAAHGRHGPPRRRGAPLHHGAQEGPDHHGGGKNVSPSNLEPPQGVPLGLPGGRRRGPAVPRGPARPGRRRARGVRGRARLARDDAASSPQMRAALSALWTRSTRGLGGGADQGIRRPDARPHPGRRVS